MSGEGAENSGSNNELSRLLNQPTPIKPHLGKRRRNNSNSGRHLSLNKMISETNKNRNNNLAGLMNNTKINDNIIQRAKKRASLAGGKKKRKTTRKRKHKSKRRTRKRH